jgi:electron transport complex protein RnfC
MSIRGDVLMSNKIKWGIHPDTHKSSTESKAIETNALPSKVIIPVRQHIGAPCEPIVKKGDVVKKGQLIATSEAFVSSPIHASLSGTVVEVANKPHPIFGEAMAIVIENDGLDQWAEGIPAERNWETLEVKEMVDIVKNAGIVGMGGATFPTHVKLVPPKDVKIDTLIINAAECEPFLTADHRIMLEYSERLVTGILMLKKILGVDNAIVGIEDNKMDAVKSMKDAVGDKKISVIPIATRYPQGGEKMIIKTLLNREVPSGQLPMNVGVVVQNAATAIAICDAVRNGIPLIERVVTVTGSAIKEPKNLLLRIGTTFADAIEQCGGFKFAPEKLIMGGPFMGMAQYTTEVPIIKGANGILAFGKEEMATLGEEGDCIRCGRCVGACPMGLNPSMLSILSQKGFIDEAKEDYSLFDCMECGCCSFVCPAKRKIVHHVRLAKKLSAEKGGK